ncbi:hypothetical protein [Alkalicoccus chagannorensis]|uniref:hypothetical protein n=1 Tax=Alkalicoccus chagannorensis TaxID=427072 RepID=UPI00041F9106|nr:hypothetical protein [Alkalicoccus chagannorensis]
MLTKLRNLESDTMTPYVLTTAPLLLLLAFFVPPAVIMLGQDTLFFSYDHWSFIRPDAAFQGVGAAMIWLAVVLVSWWATKIAAEKRERPYKLTGLHLTAAVLTLPAVVLSLSHYAYLDESAAVENKFFAVGETRVAWDDVEHVVREAEAGSRQVTAYSFEGREDTVTIPYDSSDYQTVQAISRVQDMYAWDVEEQRDE